MKNKLSNAGVLVMISVDKIEPHPDNPRKDIGDIEELTASIKAKGILQNLTVVPWFPEGDDESLPQSPAATAPSSEGADIRADLDVMCDGVMDGWYRALIGHRRLAAAKAAGITEVPCVVAELTREEQIEVMLLENMQRSDLTAYEQGQAFQMLMDFGNDVATISEKTGFSESTVRRRIKLTELDGAALQRASEKQVTFEELERLSKIEDVKTRNLVLCEYGTRNYENKMQQALDVQKKEKDIKRWREFFARRGFTEIQQKDCFNFSIYEHVCYVNYGWEEEELEKRISEEKTYYFCDYYGSFYIRTDKVVYERDDDEEELSPEELERQEREARENERREKLSEASERAYRLRHDFIKDFHVLAADRMKDEIIGLMIGDKVKNGYGAVAETDELCDLFGITLPEEWSDEMMLPEITEFTTRNPGKALLCLLYLEFGDSKNNDYYGWRYEYDSDNAGLNELYDVLVKLGYEMSDEELQLQDGSHPLYVKEEE